jgi:CheY-like chemotaxis protein/HPt (histidine-containing phosphotransfer) domain-containing protein
MTKPVRRTRLRNALLEALGIQTQRDQRPRELDGAGTASSPLVLVAEDNDVNQILAARMLERRGYRSEVVNNGRQAVEALETGSFDAVLMDCQMPGLSGYDATRELRRRERGHDRTPVIAMTANALLGDREDCLACGMDDYIAKPLKPDELDRVLQRWAPRLITASPLRAQPPDAAAPEAAVAQRTLDRADLQRLHSEVGTACFASLVDLFGTQQPGMLADLHEAIERGDAHAVRERAHKLAGGCATMGVPDMTALCRQLEARARAGSLEGAAALADDIDATFLSAHAALVAHVALLPA